MDYSQYGDQQDFSELIPHGALSWGILRIRAANLQAGVWETTSKNPKDPSSPSKYLDCEITLEGGKWDKRKVWTKIGVAGTPGYIKMGGQQIRAILQTARGASDADPTLYYMDSHGELDGMKVGVKIKVEPPQGSYSEKNDVAVFLSPEQNKGDWAKLVAGDCEPDPNARAPQRAGAPAGTSTTPAGQPRWAAASAPAPTPGGVDPRTGMTAQGQTPPVQPAPVPAPTAPAAPAPAAIPPWVAAQGTPGPASQG
jgi:hypothetical protein